MAGIAGSEPPRYPRMAMRAHYDPEVDIALFVIEQGDSVSEEHSWGLLDRSPNDEHLMGFEIWDARRRLPAELIDALPTSNRTSSAA